MPRSDALLCFALALLGGVLACAHSPEAPATAVEAATRRVLPAGVTIGATNEIGAHVWRGLPFAKAPVGPLRWMAPRPAAAWPGVRQAVSDGSACPQPTSMLTQGREPRESGMVGDEDCLYLNVFAPVFAPKEVPRGGARRPVMFWIHGGGNVIGEGSGYDGSVLAERHGVIVVAVNYRLGPLGWMRHQALRAGAESEFDASGNFGTLDLVEALRWVNINISAFGGDPGNVTIFGESAGGLNVISLLLAKPAEGLFHRAITQSGGTWSSDPHEAENWRDAARSGKRWSSSEITAALVRAEPTTSGPDEAREHVESLSEDALATYLRSKSADEIWAPLVAGGRGEGNLFDELPMVFREGSVLPSRPFHEAFARGDQHRVPVVLGTNRDESKTFMFGDPEYIRRWFGLFPQVRDWEVYERDAYFGSALWKADGADEIASALHGHQPGQVFVYRFDWDEEPKRLGFDLARLLGAGHGLEIPFVFGTFDLGFLRIISNEENEPGRAGLSDAMMSYWTRFAATGDPGLGRAGTLPAWTAWDETTAESHRSMIFDTEAGGGLRMSAETVTFDGLAAEVQTDSTFSAEERCEALDAIAKLAHHATEVAGCADDGAKTSPKG
ncbi:MAG: carboxylesterase family protein [bacterium]|nr:carboxylesterase family protein [bacterium]